jgi:hypothetical protein
VLPAEPSSRSLVLRRPWHNHTPSAFIWVISMPCILSDTDGGMAIAADGLASIEGGGVITDPGGGTPITAPGENTATCLVWTGPGADTAIIPGVDMSRARIAQPLSSRPLRRIGRPASDAEKTQCLAFSAEPPNQPCDGHCWPQPSFYRLRSVQELPRVGTGPS